PWPVLLPESHALAQVTLQLVSDLGCESPVLVVERSPQSGRGHDRQHQERYEAGTDDPGEDEEANVRGFEALARRHEAELQNWPRDQDEYEADEHERENPRRHGGRLAVELAAFAERAEVQVVTREFLRHQGRRYAEQESLPPIHVDRRLLLSD